MNRIALASGVVVEDLGVDLMVMVPGSTEVLTLSGDAAEAVRLVQSGSPVTTDAVVSDLVRLGVLESPELSRRGLIKAGAIGAGAGIAVMAMPSVAAASSLGYLDGTASY
jgi:TctA family transporter